MNNDGFRELARQIGVWMMTGSTGLSSEYMAAIALGADLDKIGMDYPYDRGSFGRCLGLLNVAPGVREFFPKIATTSEQWRLIIENWDSLVKAHHEGDTDLLKKTLNPEKFLEDQKRQQEAEEERKATLERHQKELTNPNRNANGAIIFPPLENQFVQEEVRRRMATTISNDLLSGGYISDSELDDTINELADSYGLGRRSGYDVYKSMDWFDDENVTAIIEIIESVSIRTEYGKYIQAWVENTDIDVSPVFSVGDKVSHPVLGNECLIDSINDGHNPHFPFTYFIKVAGKSNKSILSWDEENLTKLED
ncbi:MAG: hypothetical protein GW898_10720 [Thiomicrospira sp.]|nr:hypothetical protein [Thiomicrospira sp.]NCN66376.1 hypothetical protein [Thiomicrospira sp.]NCO14830.1 hypothetical protein [Thiomicrospira sp.]NCO82426.1 hypothetical protein [Thiomicrospira sp.]OIP95444.1 MAG: hypothetical protein AUK56_05235 [Thiomicrospira sp. CG2_30_44_34]